MNIELNEKGHEILFIHETTVSQLAAYLNPEIPYVWILGHMPNPYVEWWDASLPLSTLENIQAKVRLVTYDFQMKSTQFIQRANSFDSFGLVLIQSTQEMPDTLDLSRIPEGQQENILIENGAFLRIYLPHAYETACITCYETGYLESIHP